MNKSMKKVVFLFVAIFLLFGSVAVYAGTFNGKPQVDVVLFNGHKESTYSEAIGSFNVGVSARFVQVAQLHNMKKGEYVVSAKVFDTSGKEIGSSNKIPVSIKKNNNEYTCTIEWSDVPMKNKGVYQLVTYVNLKDKVIAKSTIGINVE